MTQGFIPCPSLGEFFLPNLPLKKNLGVLFASKFSFTYQVNFLIKSCFANQHDSSYQILYLLASLMVTNALVSSCQDYCNSLFHSLSSKILQGFNIQNRLTHLVTGASRFTYITPINKFVQWIPVKLKILNKIFISLYHM